MDFQSLNEFVDCRAAREERRHDNDRAKLTRNTIVKLEPGEHGGAKPIGDHAVHQRDCGIDGNKESQKRQRQQNPSIGAGRIDRKQCQREKQPGSERDRREIACNAHRRVRADQPILHRNAKAKFLFERSTSLSDQVITGIAPARIRLSCFSFADQHPRVLQLGDDFLGYIDFRMIRTARKLLDGAAIPVTRRKIHVGEVTARP